MVTVMVDGNDGTDGNDGDDGEGIPWAMRLPDMLPDLYDDFQFWLVIAEQSHEHQAREKRGSMPIDEKDELGGDQPTTEGRAEGDHQRLGLAGLVDLHQRVGTGTTEQVVRRRVTDDANGSTPQRLRTRCRQPA